MWESATDQKLTLYSSNIGPGFTEGELKAILPVGGRLLSPKEIYGTPLYEYVDVGHPLFKNSTPNDRKNVDLHDILMKSITNNDPVGVNQIQYPNPIYTPFYLLDKIWDDRWLMP